MQWSLENIYKNQVSGKVSVPPRKHLRVLGEATFDEVMALLTDLNDKGLLEDEVELAYIKQYLTKRPYEKSLLKYLKSKNLNEGTIVEGNVQEIIIKILSNHTDLEAYDNYIQEPKPFSSVVKRSGNLVDVISEIAGLKKETATDLVNIKGSESGRGVGKGEIAMAAIFSDVKMAEGKGDLDWNGQYLEVKATDARLGKRDREFPNFERTTLGELATQYDKTDKRIDTLVANLANESEMDRGYLFNALLTFISAAYPNNSIEIPRDINLTDPQQVRKAVEKAYTSNYASGEGVDWFIMINSSKTKFFGRYFIFQTSEISDFIDENKLKLGVIGIGNLDPSLGTI